MNTENEVKAKLEIEHIAELQKYKDEFEKLGKNDWGLKDLISIFLPFVLLSIANSFYDIETELFQIICFIFMVSAMVQGMIRDQTKKTNRRIDLLVKIIKYDQKGG
ncbi:MULTISPECIES: hypothetical protein [Pseudoalteromonas]|uniref:hypothetical protein n=1 Tax=Pseudoalteromonas TaxID=53246 RepID=UPI0003105C77|nr:MULTISPECIES: hypothetical protein [Pseudoalteromonas]MCF6145842.1 hypothetical protein [Pseudoalteromonas mariniglutinosa NCIMB 1770]TMN71219.1 hypothetical protein CWB85_12195 [Pseudoalteromonas sp. S1727]